MVLCNLFFSTFYFFLNFFSTSYFFMYGFMHKIGVLKNSVKLNGKRGSIVQCRYENGADNPALSVFADRGSGYTS